MVGAGHISGKGGGGVGAAGRLKKVWKCVHKAAGAASTWRVVVDWGAGGKDSASDVMW